MSYIIVGRKKLQSTPSVGRATFSARKTVYRKLFLSTPSVGRATVYLDQEQANEVFLSTPSVGRATDIPIDVQIGVTTISIHALRGEGDAKTGLPFCPSIDFYPRPPWGGRPPRRWRSGWRCTNFYPRPPWGGRRETGVSIVVQVSISIHALRGEGDLSLVFNKFNRF